MSGDWTFAPVIENDGSGGKPEVVAFYAYVDESTRTGSNLSAVWYQLVNGTWTAKSWYSTDAQETLASARKTLSVTNTLWEGLPGAVFVGVPEKPKDFSQGVLASDPVAHVVAASADPVALVSTLVGSGYAAADIPSIGRAGCAQQAVLEDLALRSVDSIMNGDDTIASVPVDALCAGGRPPVGPPPTRPPKPNTAPPWSPSGTVPTAPAWTPGGWPVTGTPPTPAWRCFPTVQPGGGSSCFCSRSQDWGRWETYDPWIGPSRVRWHTIRETETCTNNNVPCPTGGPPAAGSACTSTYN